MRFLEGRVTEIHCAVFGRTNGALVSMVNVAEVDAGRQPTRIGLLGRIGRTADGAGVSARLTSGGWCC